MMRMERVRETLFGIDPHLTPRRFGTGTSRCGLYVDYFDGTVYDTRLAHVGRLRDLTKDTLVREAMALLETVTIWTGPPG